ncbi:MAG: 3-phosphoshikimate 1-carboxyvinyltransferase [Oscillospiraceae bacterium]|nr:3-phosphoshikimate 1-carboxyvinyltransferase [Oscillospiraceae bacterium]
MRAEIYPSSPGGCVEAPPSKSMAQRLLICAGLARGEGSVEPVDMSEDVAAALDCVRALGAEVRLEGGRAVIRGTDPARAEGTVLRCRDSAAALRFFIPLCLLSGREMRLEGSAALMSRPLTVYEELCRERGLTFEKYDRGVRVKGRLDSGQYELDGAVSSQFISGLLFALPLTRGKSIIRLRTPAVSRAYIDMTLSALRGSGVKAGWVSETELETEGGQSYIPGEHTVEGDWSNAAFFLALGASVTGLDENSLQGDRICAEYFRALDEGRPELDLSGCPDLGPVMFAYAAMRNGGVFTGTRRLRIKESDRGAAMAEELRKFGAAMRVEENRISVEGGISRPSQTLCGHGDHRVVMALSVLCAAVGGTIDGAEAVKKSFPDFFLCLEELGVRLTLRD